MNIINLTLRIRKIDMPTKTKTKNQIIIEIELEITMILKKMEIFQKTNQLQRENPVNYQNMVIKIKLKRLQIK